MKSNYYDAGLYMSLVVRGLVCQAAPQHENLSNSNTCLLFYLPYLTSSRNYITLHTQRLPAWRLSPWHRWNCDRAFILTTTFTRVPPRSASSLASRTPARTSDQMPTSPSAQRHQDLIKNITFTWRLLSAPTCQKLQLLQHLCTFS